MGKMSLYLGVYIFVYDCGTHFVGHKRMLKKMILFVQPDGGHAHDFFF